MSDHLYWYSNTIPANTPITALFTAPMVFNAANVENIQVIVPPGPAGSVGWQIQYGGGTFIPLSTGQFIVAEAFTFDFPQNKAPNGGNWTFAAYNNDYVPHLIQVGFYANDFVTAPTTSAPLIGL